jgi:hypothetical protein
VNSLHAIFIKFEPLDGSWFEKLTPENLKQNAFEEGLERAKSTQEKDNVEGIVLKQFKYLDEMSLKILPMVVVEYRERIIDSIMKISQKFNLNLPVDQITVPVQDWFYLVFFKNFPFIMAWVEDKLPRMETINRIITKICETCEIECPFMQKYTYKGDFYTDIVIPNIEAKGFEAKQTHIQDGSVQWILDQITDDLPETSQDMYSTAELGQSAGEVIIRKRIFESDQDFFHVVKFNTIDFASVFLFPKTKIEDFQVAIKETFVFLKDIFGFDNYSGHSQSYITGCNDSQMKFIEYLDTLGKKKLIQKALMNLAKITDFSSSDTKFAITLPSLSNASKQYRLEFDISSNSLKHDGCVAWAPGSFCYHVITFFLKILSYNEELEQILEDFIRNSVSIRV